MSKPSKSMTLGQLAGTTRGLSNLTVSDLKSLLKGEAPAKAVVAKPTSEFYEKVIVGGREDRQNHQKANTEAAAWMREKGLVPSGKAWTAVKNGERSVKVLKALNESDGLAPKTKTKGTSTGAQPVARTKKAKETPVVHDEVTERDIEAEVAILVAAGFTDEDARVVLG